MLLTATYSTARAGLIRFQGFEAPPAGAENYGFVPTDQFGDGSNRTFNSVESVYGTLINPDSSDPNSGDRFWGLRDVQGEENLVFETLDLSQYENVSLSFSWLEFDLDEPDRLSYTLALTSEAGLEVRTETLAGPGSYGPDNSWNEVVISDIGSVESLDFTLHVSTSGSFDAGGWDSVAIRGDFVGPAAVPEPTSLLLGGLAGSVWACTRRRRACRTDGASARGKA
ncbi:PEP-CTERM sorting domain-containing protein [Alienimonas chondri]|uniref:PEP-CTERM sorting domain-containing protein n=1 Tax=Alienimonas chondri TaxID=2681879 RepID=A0ABX1VHP4_9PLAN|nr:PEP-CTERM sorting domain-containing protein [Alienimonas chondri]NNJ26296.1 hypothetical protein [Alienimonas chondri]